MCYLMYMCHTQETYFFLNNVINVVLGNEVKQERWLSIHEHKLQQFYPKVLRTS